MDETLTGTAHWIRVNLGIMALKGYSTLSRSPELEPHHQMLFSVIFRHSLQCGCLTPLQRMQSVYSKSHQQGRKHRENECTHRTIGQKQNQSINIRYLIVHSTCRELSSHLKLYKNHKHSRNKQKSSYSKKMETTFSSQVWKSKEGAPSAHCWGANYHITLLKSYLGKRQIPWFPLSCWWKRTCVVGELFKYHDKVDYSV